MRLCPVCKVELTNTLREGIEIDYCPTCRGVWLDRNELEKIIGQVTKRQSLKGTAAVENKASVPLSAHPTVQRYPPPHHKPDDSYLLEIFDFDD